MVIALRAVPALAGQASIERRICRPSKLRPRRSAASVCASCRHHGLACRCMPDTPNTAREFTSWKTVVVGGSGRTVQHGRYPAYSTLQKPDLASWMGTKAPACQPQRLGVANTGDHLCADNVLGVIEHKETIMSHRRSTVFVRDTYRAHRPHHRCQTWHGVTICHATPGEAQTRPRQAISEKGCPGNGPAELFPGCSLRHAVRPQSKACDRSVK